jgi:hypothetical protein
MAMSQTSKRQNNAMKVAKAKPDQVKSPRDLGVVSSRPDAT